MRFYYMLCLTAVAALSIWQNHRYVQMQTENLNLYDQLRRTEARLGQANLDYIKIATKADQAVKAAQFGIGVKIVKQHEELKLRDRDWHDWFADQLKHPGPDGRVSFVAGK